jgi:hypothetical protein
VAPRGVGLVFECPGLVLSSVMKSSKDVSCEQQGSLCAVLNER